MAGSTALYCLETGMKIAAPISILDELEPVIAAGADEIYLGCVPEEWRLRFGPSGMSRRPMGNLDSIDSLKAAIDRAGALGATVSLTLNQQHYDKAQLDRILEISRIFADSGGYAMIVADIGLMSALADIRLNVRIHVSSIAAVRNSQTARFFQDQGADRIVFPRYLTLKDIELICANAPDMEYEAFVLNDGCIFDEAVCHTIHLPGRVGGAICMDNYTARHRRADERSLSALEADLLRTNDQTYKRWAWHKFSCGFSTTEDGYPFGPCGLCAIPSLARAGIGTVKIAGREFPTKRKVKSIEMVKRVLRRLESGDDVARFAVGLRNRPDLCAEGHMCYYPDLLPDLGTVVEGSI